jgi:tRNA1Val (adenine37-N6)-methyltransferase
LSGKTEASKIYGIEIQKDVAEMAERSVELNNLQDKIQIINDNINNIEKYFDNNSLDVVVTNPPYQKNNTGLKSENEKHLISRHEIECTLEDIIQKSFKVLKDKGEFYMVHRPERLVDILYLMRKNKLEPKELKMVYPKNGEKANLVLIKGVKNANEFLNVLKPLVIYNEDGSYTKELLKIYNK